MLGVFKDLKKFLKVSQISSHGFLFGLHCKFTAVLCIFFMLGVAAKDIVGDNIACTGSTGFKSGDDLKFLDAICYIESTFTIPENKRGGHIRGLGTLGDKKHHKYYQWVVYVLALMSALCYAPYYLWRIVENHVMKSVASGLVVGVETKDEVESKSKPVVTYFLCHFGCHRLYAFRYFFCEFLCLLNVLGQIFLLDRFFDGEFYSYGMQLFNIQDSSDETSHDTMTRVFPRIAKCLYQYHGASGSLQKIDSICVLSQNIINEKVFIFIWVWYNLLAMLFAMLLLLRIILICFPWIRVRYMLHRYPTISFRVVEDICEMFPFGDWWVLFCLGANIDQFVYSYVLESLSEKIAEVRMCREAETPLVQPEPATLPSQSKLATGEEKIDLHHAKAPSVNRKLITHTP